VQCPTSPCLDSPCLRIQPEIRAGGSRSGHTHALERIVEFSSSSSSGSLNRVALLLWMTRAATEVHSTVTEASTAVTSRPHRQQNSRRSYLSSAWFRRKQAVGVIRPSTQRREQPFLRLHRAPRQKQPQQLTLYKLWGWKQRQVGI
jgi:hypothetical protein